MSLFRAHIFKKRSRGEREEVEIRLFNLDGSPANLGEGGGGASAALHVASHADELVELEAVAPLDIPFGNTFVLHNEGFDFEAGDLEIPAPLGVYLFQIEDSWTSLDSGASSGEARSRIVLTYPDSEDPGTIYYDDMISSKFRAPYSSGGAYKVGIAIVNEANAKFMWQVDQNSQELGMNWSANLTIIKL